MERFVVPNMRLFDEFINENNLIHTDPRFNLGDRSHVFDVVQYTGHLTPEERYKRILLIRAGYETQADYFWHTLASTGENYILPERTELSTDKIIAYEIPVSSRPLLTETKKYKNEAQNRMNNEIIAKSLGKMVRLFAESTGLYIDQTVLKSRSAIVDFVDEDVEPTLLTPPITYVPADMGISEFYTDLFGYDYSFKIPFIEAIENR